MRHLFLAVVSFCCFFGNITALAQTFPYDAIVRDDENNVREFGGPNYKQASIVGILNKNDKVHVLEIQGRWARINGPGELKGWVNSACLVSSGPATLGSSIPIFKPGENFVEPITGMKFVWVPGGSFEMGCGNWVPKPSSIDEMGARAIHPVAVDGFWIGQYEVTQWQWKKVMGTNPAKFNGSENNPVERVSWEEANLFINKLNGMVGNQVFRLPTEAEWEYAARYGNEKELYSGGNNLNDVAWNGSNSGGVTHVVGTKKHNRLEIYDMSGNVREWVLDSFSENAYKHAVSNPQILIDDESRKVIRGGGIDSASDYWCYSCFRCQWPKTSKASYIGFRLASGGKMSIVALEKDKDPLEADVNKLKKKLENMTNTSGKNGSPTVSASKEVAYPRFWNRQGKWDSDTNSTKYEFDCVVGNRKPGIGFVAVPAQKNTIIYMSTCGVYNLEYGIGIEEGASRACAACK